jgi:hypothetical protein
MADDNAPVLGWPLDPGERGREVWYGLVGPRDGSVAFWYRYTLLSTVDGRREGRLWAALTDREADASTFVSEAVDLEAVDATAEPFSLRVGTGELRSSSARGAVDEVSWDLSYDPDPYSFTPLRSERLTDLLARAAGTGKHWSRNEAVTVDGEVTVGDRTVRFEGAPGHQGHTLGSDPPEAWTWVQCNGLEDPSVAVECLNLDGSVSMCLCRDGTVHELNRVHHVLSPWHIRTEGNEVGSWRLEGRGDGVDLAVTVEADEDHWQRVAYCAPDERLRYNARCSVSSVTLSYEVDDESRRLTSDAGRAEWVGVDRPIPGEYRPVWE